MEVIYTGIRQTPEDVCRVALQEEELFHGYRPAWAAAKMRGLAELFYFSSVNLFIQRVYQLINLTKRRGTWLVISTSTRW
jgi:hypothetical protein